MRMRMPFPIVSHFVPQSSRHFVQQSFPPFLTTKFPAINHHKVSRHFAPRHLSPQSFPPKQFSTWSRIFQIIIRCMYSYYPHHQLLVIWPPSSSRRNARSCYSDNDLHPHRCVWLRSLLFIVGTLPPLLFLPPWQIHRANANRSEDWIGTYSKYVNERCLLSCTHITNVSIVLLDQIRDFVPHRLPMRYFKREPIIPLAGE